VPNGSGEKAKGAILSRAVQYIHHLKENEARNIEKWTLEKLLMDQAMGDLQAQLEEVKRRWEEESMLRSRAEAELEALKNMNGISAKEDVGTKRRSAEAPGKEGDGKRQRTD
jgi:bHLH factor